ncbi:MAG TPA: hypothetical protein PK228_02840 [Saprospiraceae bacterium]|nr:hypothetical protein [Saprospiraceae bacterium]
MKHIYFSLGLLFFIIGCKQKEADYAIDCQFPPDFYANRVLIMTNQKGERIAAIDVPAGVSNITQQITVEDADATESYGLHLVYNDPNGCYANVYSHVAIPNGAAVFLNPNAGDFISAKQVVLNISGIETFDTLVGASLFPPLHTNFIAAEKRVVVDCLLEQGRGIVLRLLANGASEFRHLYLPDSVLGNAPVQAQWEDFTPENNPRSIELPGDGLATYLEVDAVSADFNRYVTIQDKSSVQNGNAPFAPIFNHPFGLPEPSAYRVIVYQDGTRFEKIFQPGELLRFDPAGFSVDDVNLEGRNLSATTSGDVDLVSALFAQSDPQNPNCIMYWYVDGSTEAFKNGIPLPDLQNYLPDWFDFDNFKNYTVTAQQFGKQDYPQVREGFPYKSGEPFAVARSGFKSISKSK